jgi:hypothetical protein
VAPAGELQLDPLVDEPFATQAIAYAHLGEQVDRPLLEHAGADSLLDVLAAPVLEDDGIDALEVQEVRQHESGGTGTDDPDLRLLFSQPQISSAVSTISRSFAICCSWVTRLPSTVDENPHCGERQSWSSGT